MKKLASLRFNMLRRCCTVLSILMCTFFFAMPSHAGDFTARYLNDFGNVTVMEVTGNYDAHNPDGTVNAAPRQAIAKEFFRTHNDEYDFVVVFSNFDFKMPDVEVRGFYTGVKNDIRGIGQEIFDNTSLYGSNGKLQGTIDMGNLATNPSDPLNPRFEATLDVLNHEMLHRWAAYVKFRDWNGAISKALIGKDGSHWSYLLDTKGSLQYGHQWQDNGNGTFTAVAARKYYSPLDLYLMGMIDKSRVPPMLLIENTAIDPARMSEVGATISGTPRTVSIDDIIAAEGERVPSVKDSQKSFKVAFILVTTPGTFTGQELYGIESIRNGFLTRYSILTDGQGLVQVASTPKENLPVNPGVRPPSTVPRALPPSIDDGVKWLTSHQQNDGSWTDFALTTERDTAETVSALQLFPVAQAQSRAGLQWLESRATANTDYLARRLDSIVQAGGDAASLVQEILARRNLDGGWGSGRNFISNPTDTALVLKALARAGFADQQVIGKALAFLQASQNSDGGWRGDEAVSMIQPTATVLTVFNAYRKSYALESRIGQAIAFLSGKQNVDGGFGNSPSTVYDTSLAVMALQQAGADKGVVSRGIGYLNGQQDDNGSWQESPYQTALAVRAIWQATVDPDLSITPTDISIIPEKVTSLPTTAVIGAVIWNFGRTDVPLAKVAIYDGEIAPEKKVGEQTVALPGQSPVTVTFSVSVPDGATHYYYVVADPDNLIKETNKENNSAARALAPEATYDFEIVPGGVTVSANPVDFSQEVTITAKVTNKGTMTAYNVPIRFFIDMVGAPYEIATITADIPAGGSVVKEVVWKAAKAGVNLPLTVQVDPANAFAEISKTNNSSSLPLTVNSSSLPNLTVSYKDVVITPSPANERGSATISVLVKNEGFSVANNVTVNLYKGVVGRDGVVLGSQVIPVLAPGESVKVSIDWTGIADAGERIISIQVDPDNLITEIAKDDNLAFINLSILSLPDLAVTTNSIAISPSAPKDGDMVSIVVTVKNQGGQDAANVNVQLKEGSSVNGTQVIPVISGNSQASATFSYNSTGQTGTHQLSVLVDPNGSIVEQSKDNNAAAKTIGVQNAKLWVSEQYISPNGDGVKDSTQFFFRLDAPATVKVVAVDKKGTVVRNFSGGDLDNTSGTTITWDGLNDAGTVVGDGVYQIQVRNIDDSVISSLLVTVDNNRSSLSEAIGTRYLYNRSIQTPSKMNFAGWIPDDSGVLFQNQSAYCWSCNPDMANPSGLFFMPTDSGEITQISPPEWFFTPYDSSNVRADFLPDGSKFIVIYSAYNKTVGVTNYSQLFTYNRDDGSWSMLDESKVAGGYYNGQPYTLGNIEIAKPSPDGKKLAYSATISNSSYPYRRVNGLYVINSDGTGKTKLFESEQFSFVWSPGGDKIAFTEGYNPGLWISDVTGNSRKISADNVSMSNIIWIDNDRILKLSQNDLSIVSLADPENAKNISSNTYSVFVSPDKSRVILFNTDYTVKVYDVVNNVYTYEYIYPFKNEGFYDYIDNSITFNNRLWSKNGNKFISFVNNTLENIPDISYKFEKYLLTIDTINSIKYLNKINDDKMYWYSIEWIDDNETLLAVDSADNGATSKPYELIQINSSNGVIERTNYFVDFHSIQYSPLGNYLYSDWYDYVSGTRNTHINLLRTLSNLTAELYVTKQQSSLLMKGFASDLNFEGYKIEYSDIKTPNIWNLVAPPSDVPVVNDVFTSWVPPYEGSFYIRLTAWDKAGNTAISRKRVSWGLSSHITNLYKSIDVLSPNGDGVKDTVELHYRVLEPVHLEFAVYDEANNLVRTFVKEHTSPIEDHIVWDGKDESGMVVPDGKYKIKVFDYEFFVDLDSTQPAVNVTLSRPAFNKEGRPYVTLMGHAYDKNIKNWIIEYGEGDNPQEWHELKKGSDVLAGKDSEGGVAYPVVDDVAVSFYDFEVGWLGGKKIRITAEDFAGNRSSAATGAVDEKMVLFRWDSSYTSNNILPDQAVPGIHSVGGFLTLKLPVTKMSFQYWNGSQWLDGAEVPQFSSGAIKIQWDTSSLALPEGFGVRVKATDIEGGEHYSNALSTTTLFGIGATCGQGLNAANVLFEELQSLKVQVRSSQDPAYPTWTDYKVYDAAKGETIPTGRQFPVPAPSTKIGLAYQIRMVATAVSGKVYESNIANYPQLCPVAISLKVSHDEAKGCNELAPGNTTLAAAIQESKGDQYFESLGYFLQKPDGAQLLSKVDLSREAWSSASLDASSLPEGLYPVRAVLTYLDKADNVVKTAEASATMTVDRVPPAAQITYPSGGSLKLCPIKVAGPRGEWYGIPVEAAVTDNSGIERYELFYGQGEDPKVWLPATFPALDETRNLVNRPIAGKGAIRGRIGVWDISGLRAESYTLKLRVTDAVGNVSCVTTRVVIDNVAEVTSLSTDKSLLSPNADGVMDDVRLTYQIDEYAQVDVKVFKLLRNSNNAYSLDSNPLKTVVSGLSHLSGSENAVWDGKNDASVSVPDGLYGIAVYATDSCGNTTSRWMPVEVDNTPPTASFEYPKSFDPLPPGNIVEVKGTATDPNFKKYILDVGQGDAPDTWIIIGALNNPVAAKILGVWNTFGKEGRWTLRLRGEDLAGNVNVATSILDLGARKTLIKNLEAVPKLFSPNGDRKLDTTLVNYEVTDACQIKVDIIDEAGIIVRSYESASVAAAVASIGWDGRNKAGTIVADGLYTLKLMATLASNPLVTQTESISITVDTAAPVLTFPAPTDKAYLNVKELPVVGTISDNNLVDYAVAYSGISGTIALDRGVQNRSSYTFGTPTNLAEEAYTVTAEANDQGENQAKLIRTFIIDRTAPKVAMDTPKAGEYYGNASNVIDITGAIAEKNLERFSLRYGIGDDPTEWKEIVGGDSIPTASQLAAWKVGKNDGVADGVYTLSLFARDKAGLEGEAKVRLAVDNTVPEVGMTLPKDGDYVKGPFELKGTLADTNLDKGLLELSEGQCGSAFKWSPIKNFTNSVSEGTLENWKLLPADGEYCLRLSAVDKSGNRSEVKNGLKIDTHPPSTPQLSGTIEDKTGNTLNWTKNSEPDLAGYNLYRDGTKLNAILLSENRYRDATLKEGAYTYQVKAVDFAGNESEPSNAVNLKIDLTGPNVRISTPQNGARVGSFVDINGTANSQDDFKQYRISIGKGEAPVSWVTVRTSPLPVAYGRLTQWDTVGLAEGDTYSIKLEGEDTSGNISSQQVTVIIDNAPPAAPVLLTAAPGGANVNLSWRNNAEPDLAGYLLYRNDQLANTSGTVIGNLKPYLVAATSYSDSNLADGKYRYYLVAMDQAGNTSDTSNALAVSIDTRPPHATIVDPVSGGKFATNLFIKAESPDNDIASVQFQYKNVQDASWTNLGGLVTKPPYISSLDPQGLALGYGDYQLRAVATDQGNKTDPSPTDITVTYTDLTPPIAPQTLIAKTNGKEVSLIWGANGESDLDGYNVYRIVDNTAKVKVNTSLVKNVTYLDANLADGNYEYEVMAVDLFGNESKPSNQVSVRVYAPLLIQPFTPSANSIISVTGSNGEATGQVEISVETPDPTVSVFTAPTDAAGNFKIDKVQLYQGENRLTARVTDGTGNVSRASEQIVVVYNEAPAAPTGFTTTVQNHDVALSWDANTESDLAGYNIYRDGIKVNIASKVSSGQATASAYYYNYFPRLAMDGNGSTIWLSPYAYGSFNPTSWELALPAPELINYLEIDWYGTRNSAKDFEIQAWSGHAWITLTKVADNVGQKSVVELTSPYRTDRIRVYITATNDPNASKQVGIAEVVLLKDNLVTATSYQDAGLGDRNYTYTLTAVDSYGRESTPAKVEVPVGDLQPPIAPNNLKATASNSDVVLDWSLTANSEPDLAGYLVYRQSQTGWQKLFPVPVVATSYTDIGLANGAYTYRITAVDAVGNESSPSNEATAIISVLPPPAPLHLNATAAPEGKAVLAIWEADSASSAVAYNLYRGTIAGGPYTKVNGVPISGMQYLDKRVANGATYYYVVVGVDAVGNEGDRSNEASATPADAVAPEKPLILAPAQPGAPYVVLSGQETIKGIAEPGASVELFKNGVPLGKTLASPTDLREEFQLDHPVYWMSLSPDGNTVAYVDDNNYSIWLKNLITGETTMLLQQEGDTLHWSPDGSKLVYTFWDTDSWDYRVGIYDRATGTKELLTKDMGVYEDYPSWSPDGTKIVFTSSRSGFQDVWVMELASGLFTQITDGRETMVPMFSPDGSKISYIDSSDLVVYDATTKAFKVVGSEPFWKAIDWSLDGRKLVYATENGASAIYVVNVESMTQESVGAVSGQIDHVVWTPDGKDIVYSRSNDVSGYYDLWQASLQGDERLVQDNLPAVTNLERLKSGTIVYAGLDVVRKTTLQGGFEFADVGLDPGENRFNAVATDDAGNASLSSEDVTVVYDTSMLPDVAVSAEDAFVYPATPKPGEDVVISAVVRNSRQVAVNNVEAELYLWEPSGNLTRIASTTIPQLAAGGEEVVTAKVTIGAATGMATVIAVIDPANKIKELSESNNNATRDFFVADEEALSMVATLDAERYQANQDVHVQVSVKNSGQEQSGTLEVAVEDEHGNNVVTLTYGNLSVPYGAIQNLSYVWNTGATFAGSYRLHAVLRNTSSVLGEFTLPFEIQPDVKVDVEIATDKRTYRSNEVVTVSVSVKNSGSNFIIPGLSAQTRIFDAQSNVLYDESKTLTNMLPGVEGTFSAKWQCGIVHAGEYNAVVDIAVGGQKVLTKLATFSIVPTNNISGTVTVSPSVVSAGKSFAVTYSITNSGNIETAGTVRGLLIDPGTLEVMEVQERPVSLSSNSSHDGVFAFTTVGLARKEYLVSLYWGTDEASKSLASTSVQVSDNNPPVISISSPQQDGIYSSTVIIAAKVVDDASGVARVEYQLDNGPWIFMPPVDPTLGLYGNVWSPASADNGTHVVNFRAFDQAGNASSIVSAPFTVQLDNVPPVLTVSTLGNGSSTNVPTLNISGMVWDDTGVKDLRINNVTIPVSVDGTFSHVVVLKEGLNQIVVTAADLADNRSVDDRTIIYDATAPVLEVFTPIDNSKVGKPLVEITGRVDDENASVSVRFKDIVQDAAMTGQNFAASAMLDPGLNTIEITAVDAAGNRSSQKRTVFYDNSKPTLAITEPSQDIRTNQSNITIRGTITDALTAVSVILSKDGQIYTPDLLNGIFEQTLTFNAEKLYEIIVTATDEVGNVVSAQRNIIFDTTKPLLTIAPVSTPTSQNSQVVAGTREEGTVVAVICPTATIGDVSYPTATTWQVSLSGLQTGENIISAMSADTAGNQSVVTATIVFAAKETKVAVTASPSTLWSPNHKLVPVTLGGKILTNPEDVQSVTISVIDEYGKYNFSNLSFGSKILLEAWREGDDLDGRVYTITAVATCKDGSKVTSATKVLVPHDVGK